MAWNMGFGFGIQRLIDSNQNFMRAGNAVYLRVRNFPTVQGEEWAQFGFSIAATGLTAGTRDIQITPWPSVDSMAMRSIGAAQGQLRFGSKRVLISDTFVCQMAAQLGIPDPATLWRNDLIVGLVIANQLYSIEDIVNEQLAGKTITWQLTCNAFENK